MKHKGTIVTQNSSPQPDGSGPAFSGILAGIGKFIEGVAEFIGILLGIAIALSFIGLFLFFASLTQHKSFWDGVDRVVHQEAKRIGQEARGEHVDQNAPRH